MNQLELYKANILKGIVAFKGLDLSKSYTRTTTYSSWNNMTPEEVELFIKDVLKMLVSLESNPDILNITNINFLQALDSNISTSINTYERLGLGFINISNLSNQHHEFLSIVNNIYSNLWNSPIYNRLMGFENVVQVAGELSNDIVNVQLELGKFITNKSTIDEAITSASDWVKKQSEIEQKIIMKQAGIYDERANEHITHDKNLSFISFGFSGAWWWLFFSLVASTITAIITYSFYKTAGDNNSISIGSAILHIAAVIVPAYLAVFSANQFLYHKKMYEIYKFKYASLLTMNYLLDINEKDSSKTEKILNKGLDILFSEPSIKEDSGKMDKTMVTELIKLATSSSK